MKIFGRIFLIVVIVFLTVCIFAGNYMINYALKPEDHGQNLAQDAAKWEERVPGIMSWYDSLHTAGVFRDTFVVREGVKLHAVYAPAAEGSRETAVLVHGYTDNHLGMMHIARIYRDSLGMNVLLPDLHHHGLSEGEAIQMGWFDRLDVKNWVDVAHGIFNDSLTVVHGVSMGGATTMMLSGEPDLPEYVRGFVDDCGYTSVWNQFRKELKEKFNLPPFPVLSSADLFCRLRYGWNFKEASSVAQLARCTRPMLFIHGDSDAYVPTADVYVNYDAKVQGYKSLWLVPDTAHAKSCQNHPQEYAAHLREFLEVVRQQGSN